MEVVRNGRVTVRSAVVALLVLIHLLPASAAAATVDVREAAARVDVLLDRHEAAQRRVRTGVAALAAADAATNRAEQAEGAADGQLARARAGRAGQIRAVYTNGGPLALGASLLDAGSPDIVLWRVSTVDRMLADLLADSAGTVRRRDAAASTSAQATGAAEQASLQRVRALDAVQRDAATSAAALAEARRAVRALQADARRRRAVAAAARRLAALERHSAGSHLRGPVTAMGIPADYEAAYRSAAPGCPGLRWTVLAALGQVESGHGRNNGPSSAGAIGPMQFLPRTFTAYEVDGDSDGVVSAWDPQDAIWTAARYLCVSGARGGTDSGLHRALLAYNHAEWYVSLVLETEQALLRR